jgi:tol-pal system protein YbgF
LQKKNWIIGWIMLWVAVSLWGCATPEDVRILDRETQRLQLQFNQLQKENDSFRKETDTIKKELAAFRTDSNSENKRLQADLSLRLENLRSEIRILSTEMEEYKEFLKRPPREIERLREDWASRTKSLEDKNRGQEESLKGLEGRLKALEGKVDRIASKPVEVERPVPTKEVPSETKATATGAGDLYKEAYETFHRGDLEGARRKFEAFLKQYPHTELSDNAQFWIGETYYLRKDFEKAILEYEKVIVKYPEGDKVSAALFKQALAFLELGEKTNARSLLRRVIERYPHSEQADMAKRRLEAIK